jgi:hypothetical protein
MNQTDDTTLDIYALWKVDNATEVVNDAANKGGGTALTLTGVAWDDIKDVVESALSDRVTTLDLSGVSGFEEEWDKDTLTNKGNIISLTLPETVTTLVDGTSETDYAFYGYTNLESVSGKGVTDVGVGAFAGIGLTTVDLPAATDIGDGAFYQCTALKTVSLPAVEDIGDGAFAGCTVLKTVSLSEATGIGDNAFDGCYALTTVILPEATDIGTYAFNGCYLLATVILPEATDIGTYAFNECSALETVSLPAVEDIGDGAFASCTALASLTLPAAPATPPTLGSNVFQSTGSSGTLTIYIGSGKISDYTTKWGVAANTGPNDNTSKYGSDHKAINIVE